jgi:hypothetical protein
MKSRLSYRTTEVAAVGAPSASSNVPSRVSTRSRVEMDRSVSAEATDWLISQIAASRES